MQRPILNHTKRGELVYDPFLGSGTTLAAERSERVCCGLELDPTYVDVVVEVVAAVEREGGHARRRWPDIRLHYAATGEKGSVRGATKKAMRRRRTTRFHQ